MKVHVVILKNGEKPMATKLCGQLDPNGVIQSPHMSPSKDVWITMSEVIEEWGLGEKDLWERLVSRHEELLKTGAVQANLYQQLNFGAPCTCKKDETKQVNQRCPICYGALFDGGYERLGFNTIYVTGATASIGGVRRDGLMGASVASIPTLTNITILKKFPDHAVISDGFTSGTILSPVFQVTKNFGFNGFKLDAFDGLRNLSQNNIKVEFTTDSGVTWKNIVDHVDVCLSDPAFNIQFRITLTRASATDPSPFFQILRVRFKMQQNTVVLVSKKTFPEQRVLESFGVRVGADGITWWTTPNMGILGGEDVFIQENDIFEVIQGHYKEQLPTDSEYPLSGRFKPSNVSYVEPFGRFLSQRFSIRLLQQDEPGNSVF